MNIGYILKKKRQLSKKSLAYIRENTGLSKSTLSDIENEKSNPKVETLEKICSALDIRSQDVLSTLETIKENKLSVEEADVLIDSIKPKDQLLLFDYHTESKNNSTDTFKNPEDAMHFILSQPSIMGYGGFDFNKMSDKDKIDFANDLLQQLKLLSYKYKK